MVIIMLGDVVGQSGCEAVRALLPGLRRDYRADAVIVNGENSAQGNGILPSSARHLFDSGANVITTGNHVFRRLWCSTSMRKPPRKSGRWAFIWTAG